jgi:hypothetical protein
MADIVTGVKAAGVDLGTFFAPYLTGGTYGAVAKAAAVGVQDTGSDLSNELAAIANGTAAGASGVKKAGVDLNTIFAKQGTTTYNIFGPTSGTFTLPTILGNVTMLIYLVGSGGGGGGGGGVGGGGGAGGGAAVFKSYALTSANSGQTFTYVIGIAGTGGSGGSPNGVSGLTGGATTVASGTFTTGALSAGPGNLGQAGTATGGAGGAGGTATGGTTNTNGSNGANGITGGAGGTGGLGATLNLIAGTGGKGGNPTLTGLPGTGGSHTGQGYLWVFFQA